MRMIFFVGVEFELDNGLGVGVGSEVGAAQLVTIATGSEISKIIVEIIIDFFIYAIHLLTK
jgi:hypothetical protein